MIDAELCIYDSIGRLKHEMKVTGDSVALPKLPAGLYTLLLNENGRAVRKKITIVE
ncbi:MAG: T9SS type A sorting domain-containing protein [Okeania sp. SIO3C4]|nr:T9SS type A sorting domain-containing protein [Okeania sp. SIO3C4]